MNLVWATLLGMALFFGLPNWRIAQGGAQATGTVVANRTVSDSDGTSYKPVVEFQSADGHTVRVEGQNSSNPPAYRIGQEVPVLYNPAQPEQARIDNFYELWLAPLLLGGIGSGGLLLTALLMGARAMRGQWAT